MINNSTPQLNFKCPVNLDEMKTTSNGNFCSKCQIDVIDFRNKSNDEINQLLCQSAGSTCGRFEAKQLHKPFGNWKDKIISIYQKTERKEFRMKTQKSLAVAAVSCLMWLTSCGGRQHLAGAYAFNPDEIENSNDYLDKTLNEKNEIISSSRAKD